MAELDIAAMAEKIFPSMAKEAPPVKDNWLDKIPAENAALQGKAPAAPAQGNAPQPLDDNGINTALAEAAQEGGYGFDATQVPAEFKQFVKDKGLDAAAVKNLVKTHHAAQEQAYDAMSKGWKQASETDKEFGGINFKANVAIAQAAFKQHATPALRQLLIETGFANHPEIVRFFYRLGKNGR